MTSWPSRFLYIVAVWFRLVECLVGNCWIWRFPRTLLLFFSDSILDPEERSPPPPTTPQSFLAFALGDRTRGFTFSLSFSSDEVDAQSTKLLFPSAEAGMSWFFEEAATVSIFKEAASAGVLVFCKTAAEDDDLDTSIFSHPASASEKIPQVDLSSSSAPVLVSVVVGTGTDEAAAMVDGVFFFKTVAMASILSDSWSSLSSLSPLMLVSSPLLPPVAILCGGVFCWPRVPSHFGQMVPFHSTLEHVQYFHPLLLGCPNEPRVVDDVAPVGPCISVRLRRFSSAFFLFFSCRSFIASKRERVSLGPPKG
mmetsp:Transcript_34876/g.84381  ORF Transcript_34876/g.84381 Transcript_34876/m.84381 type:complete len:309 (+) Transcript_34876:76-1002(+)